MSHLSSAEIQARIANFISQSLDTPADQFRLANLDSLSVIRLIVMLEESFGLSFSMEELNEDHMGDLKKMTAFVAKKLVAST